MEMGKLPRSNVYWSSKYLEKGMTTEKKKAWVERIPVDITSSGLLVEAGVMSASLHGYIRATSTATRKSRQVSRKH
jgi:hypothetical protein